MRSHDDALELDNGDVSTPRLAGGCRWHPAHRQLHDRDEEERIEMLSFEAYRRVSTTISLPSIGTASLTRQIVDIDPQELAAAQERDAAASQ
jgi:hypothetical protein